MREKGYYKIKWATGVPPNPYWEWAVGYWNGKDWSILSGCEHFIGDDYLQIDEVGDFLFPSHPIKGIDY